MYQNISENIKKILYGYVAADSTSNSGDEKKAEKYFINYFSQLEYFKNHQDYYGTYPIEGDRFGRAAVWAMVKGEGDDAVVLIHHNDVVTVEDFKLLKAYAYSPDELEPKLLEIKDTLSPESKSDLESGNYLFGRGVCDMKGGGSIQMALLTQYAQENNFRGNAIVLGVPDEENLSAGMRAGVKLLNSLKDKYNLNYKFMINSEPHQRKNKENGIFSLGSIGKVMPFVYVRGCLAHAGKVFEGLNPTNVMSEIVRRTEVNMQLSDIVANEAAPPPTWLYLRENKESYDVSMPLTINGCLSILTLNQSPDSVMKKMKTICDQAFNSVIDDMNSNYRLFMEATKQEYKPLRWESKVTTFGELLDEATSLHGDVFVDKYDDKINDLREKIHSGEASLIMSNFELVDFVYDYIDDLAPRVIIGLIPPYYPNVSNKISFGYNEVHLQNFYDKLRKYAKNQYDQVYDYEYYYTGISDLSYSSISDGEAVEDSLRATMPFFEKIYDLPLDEIEKISMPCINIGPWGKDFHKLTERVLKDDLYSRTPDILDFAIREIMKGDELIDIEQ